jgi:hypothetical protein
MKLAAALCIVALACSSGENATAGVDSLNARIVQAYRTHDPVSYGAQFTDSAVFEWPAFNTVRGRAELAAMARSNWTSLTDMDLRLTVAHRRFAANQVTEFGAFEQSWNDSSGKRMTEFGRYVAVLVPQRNGTWLMDRFFGFEDSLRGPR